MAQILNDYYNFQFLMAMIDMIKVFGSILLVAYFIVDLVRIICKEFKFLRRL